MTNKLLKTINDISIYIARDLESGEEIICKIISNSSAIILNEIDCLAQEGKYLGHWSNFILMGKNKVISYEEILISGKYSADRMIIIYQTIKNKYLNKYIYWDVY